ncbi:hypothetical protein [Chryseobacterium fistulae]|uniref:Lipoprotein n=1 Tax=Chryseobacterium fistulae TaxID=2675058 RepID=A0A6N4XJD1_9FLAO|nr:hypothetical protein [Chryseobacterium fistulae]CAA7385837.1 hypothetical protein CHRY9393_00123 [Chryseobacterium fistulae]
MKKNFFLLIISLLILQSCSINSEIVYHKDAASTSIMNIDVKELMNQMKATTPDSLRKKDFGGMDKIPTDWKSIYELEKEEGKLKTDNPDSIRIMKKIFVKSTKENNELTNFLIKLDHFTQDDYKAANNFNKKDKLPIDQNVFNVWDGKTLTIDTKNFNLNNIKQAIKKPSDKGEDDLQGGSEGMMSMFLKNMQTTLKFEKKIKSISGKHDWITKVDDNTVKITYDLKSLFGENPPTLKNNDQKIIITTE